MSAQGPGPCGRAVRTCRRARFAPHFREWSPAASWTADADGRYELAGHLVQRQDRQLLEPSAGASHLGRSSGRCGSSTPLLGRRRSGPSCVQRRGRCAWQRFETGSGSVPTTSTPPVLGAPRQAVAAQAAASAPIPTTTTSWLRSSGTYRAGTPLRWHLRREMATLRARLEADRRRGATPGLVLVAAAVLRHLNADPLLPDSGRCWRCPRRIRQLGTATATYCVVG